jgi:hypothetical protein
MFDFIQIREVPKTSWSSNEPLNFKPKLKTLIALIVGLILFGLGEALLVTSQMGVSPWTALAQGFSNISGFSLGFTTFFISAVDTFKTKTWDWDNFQCDYYFPGFALCNPLFANF